MHWLEKATLKRRREVLVVREPAHHEPVCDLAADKSTGYWECISRGSKPRVREAMPFFTLLRLGYTETSGFRSLRFPLSNLSGSWRR